MQRQPKSYEEIKYVTKLCSLNDTYIKMAYVKLA